MSNLLDQIDNSLLKKLSYGNDRPSGGSSKEPYIIKNPSSTPFDDKFIRGGTLFSLQRSKDDLKRISKFLLDQPKGLLFITKQIGLQFSNPRLESNNNIDSTRIYNGGINTLAQIPLGAFGGHIIRHGLLPLQIGDNTYEKIVGDINRPLSENRLIRLTEKFGIGNVSEDFSRAPLIGLNSNINLLLRGRFNNTREKNVVDEYVGGPESIYGIGKTVIRRVQYSNDWLNLVPRYVDTVNNTEYNSRPRPQLPPGTLTLSKINSRLIRNDNPIPGSPSNYLSKLDPNNIIVGTKGKLDQFERNDDNILSLGFSILNPFTGLIDTRIIFPAYIRGGISFNYNPNTTELKYFGRSDSVYKNSGGKKTTSFSFNIHCPNRDKLNLYHKNLGKLASSTLGRFDSNNRLGTNIVYVNLAGYIINEPCIISGIEYNIPEDASWDIDIVNENQIRPLSQILSVDISLIIIGNKLYEFSSEGENFDYLPEFNNTLIENKLSNRFGIL